MDTKQLKARLKLVSTPVFVNHPNYKGIPYNIKKINRSRAELVPVDGGTPISIVFDEIIIDAKTPMPKWTRLELYMDRYINDMRRACNMTPMPMPTDEASAVEVIMSLENHIAPENLSCDGELSYAEVRHKLRIINGAVKDLEIMLGREIELDE